ncbi:hypothetical protein C8F04DRAFT_1084751, partial [Mycena alexandri]
MLGGSLRTDSAETFHLAGVIQSVVPRRYSLHRGSAGNKPNFRTMAYEATSAYLCGATVHAVVQNTVVAVLTRMEQVLNMQNQIPGIEHN